MISCGKGIELLKAYKGGGDPVSVLCSLKGADTVDQLTRSDIAELSGIASDFVKSTLTPKDVTDVELEFTVDGQLIYLGKFNELDLTLAAIELVDGFNQEEYDNIPILLGCIYAPIVKARHSFAENIATVAAKISTAISEQVSFDDVYAVFDFFLIWKSELTRVPGASFRHSMKVYRYLRRAHKPTRLLINRSLTASATRSSGFMRAVQNSIFTVALVCAILTRWFWCTIESLRKLSKKKQPLSGSTKRTKNGN